MDSFSKDFDAKLSKRETLYYKFARHDSLIKLYNECLTMDPIYVPKKFRYDSYHVMSLNILEIIKDMEIKRLQSECKIFESRRDDFAKRCFEIDEEVLEIINNSNVSRKASKQLQDRWNKLINEDIERVNKSWLRKANKSVW